ncbi:MAG: hydantoinase B/oxoprolinase family protein, partial [Calditrichia bacterium]|nr:hydantoinase B/oxoprolinase family protein [Calditrichia bacterium]
GSDTYLTIPIGTDPDIDSYEQVIHNFHQRYQHRFGFYPPQDQVEAVNLRIEAAVPGQVLKERPVPLKAELPDDKEILKFQSVYFNGKLCTAPVFRRGELKPGNSVAGPAVIADDYSTIVIEPDFKAIINAYGHVVLETISSRKIEVSRVRDPVMLEVFNHLFMSIAEQMGYTLANTAHSVNMKERLDFSCAIFDRDGNLVANAPHIPVHLGAMGESVKYIKEQNTGKMNPGYVYVTNNPHHGGSHLPDVTVVSPVYTPSGELVFFVASRGHHADIGGITPGSMPPFGTTVEEEGVVIDNFLLVSENQLREREVRELLLGATYPARNVQERLSDLRAQVAANNKGIQELKRLVRQYTLPVVSAYMQHIQTNATEAMTEALGNFLKEQSVFEGQFEDYLDDGSRIAVSIRIERGENPPASHRMFIDFSNTSAETEGNLNAPTAVTKAAVLYVLRTLIDRDIPLNAGCLISVKIHIPKGCLLNPSSRAAVVGGNVETSQRIVDVLYGALGVAAASQGTMNNFLFGRDDGEGQQYYETVAGGSGAVEGQPGVSAVQVHMTNTRITDPEVLEYRFPEIFIDRFNIRRGTGGAGKWIGGDGVERAVRFLNPMRVSILSERRKYPPYGIKGGKPGEKGKNLLVRKDGTKIELSGKVDRIVEKGETIVIQTPGGGGYGAPEQKE